MEFDPDVDRDFRREILLTLATIGPPARKAVPALMQILGDKEHTLRPGAAWALAKIGAQEAAPLLIEAISKDENTHLHVVATIALAVLNPENEGYIRLALPKVIELLSHESPMIRFEAASAIIPIGPKAAAAVPKLVAGLQEKDPALRNEFLSALGAIGPASAQALPVLLATLADPDLQVRCSCTFVIGRIGPDAKAAIALLEKNLQERDEFLQMASAWALVHVDAKREGLADECLGPLTRALKVANPKVRNEAVLALGLMGQAARPALPAIQELGHDPDETVRKSVADTVARIGK
jgi:HEAT repeat protein